jgi:hypothetical protein
MPLIYYVDFEIPSQRRGRHLFGGLTPPALINPPFKVAPDRPNNRLTLDAPGIPAGRL